MKGSEFLLDGYLTLGEPKEITIGGSTYSLQYFQGEHEDEYTLKKDGTVCLFQNGMLKMVYEVDKNGVQTGSFTQFTNGRVSFVQSFDDILDQHSFNRIVNHVQGERMEIYSQESGQRLYHEKVGEFSTMRNLEPYCSREYGRGISLWK